MHPDRRFIARASLSIWLLAAACGSEHGVDQNTAARGGAQAGGSEPEEPPLSARLMSFNLRWDGFDDGANAWSHRREIVVRVLRDFGPDSVGTQEAMVRQIDDLETAIATLESCRFDNDPVYVRTQQILYRSDRFDRIEANGYLIAEGLNENGTICYCTWVRLSDRNAGRSYYHYNVHLDHRDAASRELGVVRMVKHIANRATDDPFVVTGDFNTAEDSPTMAFLRGEQTLTDENGVEYTSPVPLVDTYRCLYPDAVNSGPGGGFGGHRNGRKIDYVLVAAGAAMIHAAASLHINVDGRYPSDHFPVTAVVEWP